MKKMIHVTMMTENPITSRHIEVFLEEKYLKQYVIQTDFNKYKHIAFSTIDIWTPNNFCKLKNKEVTIPECLDCEKCKAPNERKDGKFCEYEE